MKQLLIAVFSGLSASASLAQPVIESLGLLPNGTMGLVYGMSANGNVLAGYANVSGSYSWRAFRWTQGSGMANLGLLSGTTTSQAFGVSANGSTVVGRAVTTGGASSFAFRSVNNGSLEALGALPSCNHCTAFASNSDGTVVVGYCESINGPRLAFRWSQGTGMTSLVPPGALDTTAVGITPDGSVVVGVLTTSNGGGAYRWTAQSGFTLLGLPPGASDATVTCVSEDGSAVAGFSNTLSGTPRRIPFVWTMSEGFLNLGSFISNDESYIYALTSDGTSGVGHYYSVGDGGGGKPLIWKRNSGFQDLNQYLLGLGADMTNIRIADARAISRDGTVIGGRVYNSLTGEFPCRIRSLPATCPLPVVTVQPLPVSSGLGATAVFSCSVTGADLNYRWHRNGTPLADDSRTQGAASAVLQISAVQNADQGNYYCTVTNPCATVSTNTVALSCKAVIAQQPSSANVFAGETITLGTIVGTSGSTTYRWRKDGVNLFSSGVYSGATTPILTIQTTDPSQSGAYTLAITNPCGVTVTQFASVQVSCGSDWNQDGAIDGDDVIQFFSLWDLGESSADFNRDGSIDGDDVIGFMARWDGGC